MNFKWRTAATAAVIVTFLSLDLAQTLAENLGYSDLEARLEALESEVNSQQVKLASANTATCCPVSSRSVCCKSTAWYLGYELTILQPIISELEIAGRGNGFENDFGLGHRFIVGYDGGSGMGVRMRYWFYNHGHDLTDPALGSVGIDMDVLDLEFTLEEELRNWNLMVSGGIRYGHAGLSNSASFAIVPGPARAIFDGVGPTVSFEAVRGFGDRGLYLLGNLRASILIGKNIDRQGFDGMKNDGETTTVLENQLGIGYGRILDRTALNLRIAWETQVWMNEGWGDDVYGFSSNLSFSGPSASVELRF